MEKLTVLVLDDEHLIALLVETALLEAGFSVVVEHDAASGMSQIKALGADLSALVTDIRLGSGSGWDVAKHARGMRLGLPVVYMSGDSAHEWAAEGVPKSVMIQKPFTVAQIVGAVTTLLNSESSLI
ncbi:response regulator [Brevundimonas variabilis]|uniref:DNA-binding NtrC family response regulator n=1 Tax=Brevundimonas variabilis TaxID=74312 RepID=A0A7W9CLI8_9CAUL|nr:response regulator [Brevundimonas variabilis]MBB5747407.1 DNA-binding NtrC family response regulator [Brevundimonas variabilis]